ncbi:hypothetical protein F4821DRAFT_279999 [Hypoxylon rubiginosum]|uniref:Uncharacterized protein n=1 Tax=Hypoxylon rubiginosum TaxID=110542 RepID=A0ACC0CWD1_9PEZI|nr:hypothetical protein F4821DRAFT_279999 [Hypoxylon rubiginosum]
MGSTTTTLRHILSQPKPVVPCKSKAFKNSKGDWPELRAAGVSLWTDFNLNNLNESYGHVLDLQIPDDLSTPKPDQTFAALEVTSPIDINHLIKWNDEMINPTVDFARKYLNLHNGVFLSTRVEAPDKSTLARIKVGRAPVKLDHLIALDEYPSTNLVVGLGRPTSKFHARELADEPAKTSAERFWPMRQLANLCEVAKTRYGYIQTNEDFLACCFSRNGPKSWKVAVMPIPWSRYGENQLTTDLALWWLSMLAMSSRQNRILVKEEEMMRINNWELLNDEFGWVRRHTYSKFKEPTDPPPPPPYRPPSPDNAAGNAAVFAAHVGINADPLFDFNDFDLFVNPAEAVDMNGFNFNTPVDLNTANED